MATFQFEALNESGKPQKGTISANNTEDALARIRSQGLFPTAVREAKVKKTKGEAGAGAPTPAPAAAPGQKRKWNEITISIGGIGRKALTTFTRQFSTLQDAGLPILRSLQILEQQQKPGLMKNIMASLVEDVSSGTTLSDSMARHPKAFDRLYYKMIAAGEVAGVLDMILQRLAEFLEKAAQLRRRIVGAMIYPSIVILVACAIMAFILIFIVPKSTKIFEDFNTTLPIPTLILIKISTWLAGPISGQPGAPTVPGIVYVLAFPILFFITIKLMRKSEGGRQFLDRVLLLLPVVGMLTRKATIAKFTRTLGTLVRAGVPILDAIVITRDTTGNAVYQKALQRVHESVRQGESFAEPLRQSRVVDAIVVNMIDVGEETGDLDKMLLKIADNYDDEVDVAVAGLVSLLEPLMVVVLGLIVGTIVVCLFLPLVKLIQDLH